MNIIKCTMCGGNVIISENEDFGVCENCGTKINLSKDNNKKNDTTNTEIKANPAIDTFIKRGNISLEDREWEKADNFFEEVLNIDAENAEAYIGKFLARIENSNFNEIIEFENEKINWNLDKKSGGIITRADIFTDEEKEKRDKHINEMISKYRLLDFWCATDLIKMYSFENEIISKKDYIEFLRKETIDSLTNDKIFKRAIAYAKDDIKKKIDKLFADINIVYDEAIKNEENRVGEKTSQIKKNIDKLFEEKDKEIISLYNEKLKQKELFQSRKDRKHNNVFTIILGLLVLILLIVGVRVSSCKKEEKIRKERIEKERIEKERIEKEALNKVIGNDKKKFNEFLKEGEYIPIEEFKKNILDVVNDSLKIVFVYIEGDDSEPLMIAPRLGYPAKDIAQAEIDTFIKNACEKRNINYAYVNKNEDFLRTVTLTENKK